MWFEFKKEQLIVDAHIHAAMLIVGMQVLSVHRDKRIVGRSEIVIVKTLGGEVWCHDGKEDKFWKTDSLDIVSALIASWD